MPEATLTRVLGLGPRKEGGYTRMVVEYTGPSSYTAGGETLDPVPLVGSNTILGAVKLGGNAAAGAYLIHWDTGNSKLMILDPTTGAEVSGDQDALTFRLELLCY